MRTQNTKIKNVYPDSVSMDLYDKDVVSIRDFTKDQIESILDLSQKMVPYAMGEKTDRVLDGKILGNL